MSREVEGQDNIGCIWTCNDGLAMSRDVLNILRGNCLSCTECPAFICLSGRVLCDYCGCPPAKHLRIEENKDEVVTAVTRAVSQLSVSAKR